MFSTNPAKTTSYLFGIASALLSHLHDSAPNTMAKEKQKVSSIYFALT